MTLCAFEHESN